MLSVLVVDDDELTGSLSCDLLREGGFDVDVLSNSLQVMETLRKKRYQGVVMDILMPGIDGLTLCHKIKTDPLLKNIKVIMVSGKSFESEQTKAKELGAEAFLVKPYDVENFSKIVAGILETPSAKKNGVPSPTLSENPASLRPVFSLTIWGSRSQNILGTSQYGTHTPCLSVMVKGHHLIFDAGSGISSLQTRMAKDLPNKENRIFLTHFHLPHIEGLFAFSTAQSASSTIHIAAAPEPGKTLPALVEEALKRPGKEFPKAQFELHELRERSYQIIPGIILHSFHANHPGTTLGFALEFEKRKIVYAPDAEVYGPDATAFQDYDEKFSRLAEGADLLIHDAYYNQEDYEKNKNSGHSCFLNVIGLAVKANIKRLVLIHQDSRYTDADLKKMNDAAAQLLSQKGSSLICEIAREGVEFQV